MESRHRASVVFQSTDVANGVASYAGKSSASSLRPVSRDICQAFITFALPALEQGAQAKSFTPCLLDKAMHELAEKMQPFEAGKFGTVKTLAKCDRNQGTVELMRCLADGGQDVAVKRMPNRWVTSGPAEFAKQNPNRIEKPWHDLGFLRLLNQIAFPYCCDLLGLYRDLDTTYVMTSLCTEGDLLSWCNRDPAPGEAREAVMQPIALQIFSAVRLLHDLGIAHCDLSMENILLSGGDGGLRVQIVDFGQATLDRICEDGALRGKPSYQPPEMHTDPDYDPFLLDAFALGVVLFTMSAYDYPWAGTSRNACPQFEFCYGYGMRKFLEKKRLRFGSKQTLSEVFSEALVKLLEGLLEPEPDERLLISLRKGGGARRTAFDAAWLAGHAGDKLTE